MSIDEQIMERISLIGLGDVHSHRTPVKYGLKDLIASKFINKMSGMEKLNLLAGKSIYNSRISLFFVFVLEED